MNACQSVTRSNHRLLILGQSPILKTRQQRYRGRKRQQHHLPHVVQQAKPPKTASAAHPERRTAAIAFNFPRYMPGMPSVLFSGVVEGLRASLLWAMHGEAEIAEPRP
jgi:hypothetical protein